MWFICTLRIYCHRFLLFFFRRLSHFRHIFVPFLSLSLICSLARHYSMHIYVRHCCHCRYCCRLLALDERGRARTLAGAIHTHTLYLYIFSASIPSLPECSFVSRFVFSASLDKFMQKAKSCSAREKIAHCSSVAVCVCISKNRNQLCRIMCRIKNNNKQCMFVLCDRIAFALAI